LKVVVSYPTFLSGPQLWRGLQASNAVTRHFPVDPIARYDLSASSDSLESAQLLWPQTSVFSDLQLILLCAKLVHNARMRVAAVGLLGLGEIQDVLDFGFRL
jgi:hypothetical protein